MSNEDRIPLLGIVVPVYNTEDCYLLNSLESLCQNCGEYRVAIVDDGSDEHTGKVCSQFVSNHADCFDYIRQENAGQNAARNTGWRHLNSSYTMFVDSDDVMAEGAISLICSLIKASDADLIMFGHKVCCDINDRPDAVKADKPVRCYSPSKGALLSGQCSLCGVAIATPQLAANPLAEGFHVGEDFASVVPLIASSDEIIMVDDNLYGYVQRPTSVTKSKSYQYPLEIVKAFDRLESLGISKKWPAEIEWQAIMHMLYWEPVRIVNSASKQDGNNSKKRLFGYINGHFPNWRDNPYLRRSEMRNDPGFRLLLRGHWKLYRLLARAKNSIRRVKGSIDAR